jgi:hypothetical protein
LVEARPKFEQTAILGNGAVPERETGLLKLSEEGVMPSDDAWHKDLFRSYQEFRKTVSSDFREGKIKDNVRRDLRDLYDFYIDEDRKARLAQMGRVRRFFWRLGWLLWNLILRLSPARRILLLIALMLIFFGGFSYESEHFTINFNMRVFSFLILLLILMLELKDKLLARDELALGRAVQTALLPDDNPDQPGWDIWLFTRSANEVGGDLVDYLHFQDGRLGIMLGDVSGKGLGAALLMAKLQATLRAIATDAGSPKSIGERANKILCRDGLPGRFATLIYLEVKPDADEVQIMNAGHMPAIAAREGSIEELPPVALPLGVGPDAAFFDQVIAAAPGDMLLAYSDGLTEARNRSGEFFGERRVRELITKLRARPAAEAGRGILNEIEGFVGDERLDDDLSLAVLKRK